MVLLRLCVLWDAVGGFERMYCYPLDNERGHDYLLRIQICSVRSQQCPQGQHSVAVVRHPVYGWISLAEPKQKTTGMYGTDTGTLGVLSEIVRICIEWPQGCDYWRWKTVR